MSIRLGIIGKVGTGKDTFVALWRQLAHNGVITTETGGVPYVETLKFADPLYEVCQYAHNKLSKKTVHHPQALKATNAKMLQLVGTALREAMGPEVFAKNLKDRWTKNSLYFENPSVHAFVTDVRYPEEYSVLKSLGFKFVRLCRASNNYCLHGRDPHHESEQYLDELPSHYTLVNDGSLQDFKQQVLDIYGYLNKKSSAA